MLSSQRSRRSHCNVVDAALSMLIRVAAVEKHVRQRREVRRKRRLISLCERLYCIRRPAVHGRCQVTSIPINDIYENKFHNSPWGGGKSDVIESVGYPNKFRNDSLDDSFMPIYSSYIVMRNYVTSKRHCWHCLRKYERVNWRIQGTFSAMAPIQSSNSFCPFSQLARTLAGCRKRTAAVHAVDFSCHGSKHETLYDLHVVCCRTRLRREIQETGLFKSKLASFNFSCLVK
jgi:hypothetical protein